MPYIQVDVELDEFDDDEIIKECISRGLSKRVGDKFRAKFKEFYLDGQDGEGPKTIRDEQYDEVMATLKEKFTVLELEQIANKK